MNEEKRQIVVVAAVVRREGKILLARRKQGSLAGFWEFPGGKIEPGETEQAALQREIREELSVDSRIGPFFGESVHQSQRGPIPLRFYLTEIVGEPQVGEAHDGIVWVKAEELLAYQVPPADLPIIQKLMENPDAD